MNDFGGTRSPIEKDIIYNPNNPANKYYSYLGDQGMFRLPFWDENPTYLNLASAIPYLSLNMFTPSNIKYGDSFRERTAQLLQDAPIMKDPFGAAIMENIMVPLVLGDIAETQGMFGQPLNPLDAGIVEKAAYRTRNFAESFVPNFMAYAGVVTPDSVAQYAPLYRWRDLSNAMAGKNQLGISSKEKNRGLRILAKTSGIPIQQPVNITYNQGQ
jgi:hypothetical protein